MRFVRLWFTDVLGGLKGFAITPAELETALEEGMTFDGSAIQGYSRVQESDMLAVPDPNTFEIVPWRGEDAPVARMFCDIRNLSDEPFDGDPRQVLKRNLERAREMGFTFYTAPEMEFFYFAPGDSGPVPLDNGSYFDLTTTDVTGNLRKKTIHTLESMGSKVKLTNNETSTANATVTPNWKKMRPMMPPMKATGMNTAITAKLVDITARPISLVPSRAAAS